MSVAASCFETPNAPGSLFPTGDNTLECYKSGLAKKLTESMLTQGLITQDGLDDCARIGPDESFGSSLFGLPVCTLTTHHENNPKAVKDYLSKHVPNGITSLDGVIIIGLIVLALAAYGIYKCYKKPSQSPSERSVQLLGADETGQEPTSTSDSPSAPRRSPEIGMIGTSHPALALLAGQREGEASDFSDEEQGETLTV